MSSNMGEWWLRDTAAYRAIRERMRPFSEITPEQADGFALQAIKLYCGNPRLREELLEYALGQVTLFLEGLYAEVCAADEAGPYADAALAVQERAESDDPDLIMEEIRQQGAQLRAYRSRLDA